MVDADPEEDNDNNNGQGDINNEKRRQYSPQFGNAYRDGLDGKEAASAWAKKKYKGHQVVSDSIMEGL